MALVQVKRRQVPADYQHSGGTRGAGVAAGGIAGGIAGAAIASSVTTTTVTAAGVITSVGMGVAGVLGFGLLGLLAGAVLGAVFAGDGGSQQSGQQEYIREEDFVNNEKTSRALMNFLEKMKHSITPAVRALLNLVVDKVIRPVENELGNQRSLINQIEKDLRNTVNGQAETRKSLEEMNEKANNVAHLIDI
jgi:antitoxin component of RelBE/YafQ-DinJ toxin-antitoxin module